MKPHTQAAYRRRQVIDLRPAARPGQAALQLSPGPVAQPARRPVTKKLAYGWLSYIGIVIAASMVGLVSISVAVGEGILAAYAVVALVRRLHSRTSFLLALLTLILVPIFTVLKRDLLAENYAVYAYFFLVIGTVQALVELRREPKVGPGSKTQL